MTLLHQTERESEKMDKFEKFYKKAHSGVKLKATEQNWIIDQIRSYRHVIIWGASFLGEAVGKELIQRGIFVENYWDLRSEELDKVNGVKVIHPFTTEDQQNTIIIFCIGNNVIRNALLKTLADKGYYTVLRGDFLYEGIICPFDITTGIQSEQCQGSMHCRAMFCERLNNIVNYQNCSAEDPLSIFHITLTINQKCSLKCKCCTSYMNEYPLNERVNMTLERIEKDINIFFEAVDSVGSVTVMGGEPFMHPDLSKIVRKLLTKKNLGLICIATSGTYPIKDEQLEGLSHPHVNISFSNYEDSIHVNQKNLMYKNIEKIKSADISYTVGLTMPEWIIPSTLYRIPMEESEVIEKKSECTQPPRCMMIKDGKLHPCDFAAAIYHLHIADYTTDYVDLDSTDDMDEMKKKIKEFIELPYYHVCEHCHPSQKVSKAAEQGYLDFKKPIAL